MTGSGCRTASQVGAAVGSLGLVWTWRYATGGRLQLVLQNRVPAYIQGAA